MLTILWKLMVMELHKTQLLFRRNVEIWLFYKLESFA